MARAYSDDLRRKLLEAHAAGKGTLAELAERFGVSLAWAWKISSARKRTGSMERKLYQAGPKMRVAREPIRAMLEAKPDLYLYELQAQLEASTATGEQAASLEDRRRVGLPAQKKSLHATERDTVENRQRRAAFIGRMRTTEPKRLVFLDESGVSTQRTRRFGRACGGRRVHESTPEGNWKILTVLGAMSQSGMIATMTVEVATDADIFLAYLDNFSAVNSSPATWS